MAGRNRRFHLVEDGSDDIEVGCTASPFPFGRKETLQRRAGTFGCIADIARGRDRFLAPGRLDLSIKARQRGGDVGGCGGIDRVEREAEVVERGQGAVQEGLRFLDLYLGGHLTAAHSPSVFDRDEREVEQQLPSPSSLLIWCKRCGTEPDECVRGAGPRRAERCLIV